MVEPFYSPPQHCGLAKQSLQFAVHKPCVNPLGCSRETGFHPSFHLTTSPHDIGVDPMSTQDDPSLEREFDMLMVKAGAAVPQDYRAGIIAGYGDMKRLTALLRQPRAAADETSNVYTLTAFVRSK
jgi:hypothetical protein